MHSAFPTKVAVYGGIRIEDRIQLHSYESENTANSAPVKTKQKKYKKHLFRRGSYHCAIQSPNASNFLVLWSCLRVLTVLIWLLLLLLSELYSSIYSLTSLKYFHYLLLGRVEAVICTSGFEGLQRPPVGEHS